MSSNETDLFRNLQALVNCETDLCRNLSGFCWRWSMSSVRLTYAGTCRRWSMSSVRLTYAGTSTGSAGAGQRQTYAATSMGAAGAGQCLTYAGTSMSSAGADLRKNLDGCCRLVNVFCESDLCRNLSGFCWRWSMSSVRLAYAGTSLGSAGAGQCLL